MAASCLGLVAAGLAAVPYAHGATAADGGPPSPVAAAGLPGCTTAVAPAPFLPSVRTAMVALPKTPFGVAAARDGRWSFATLAVAPDGTAPALGVFANQEFAPRLVRTIPLPYPAAGASLSPDGRYLLVAGHTGAGVIDVRKAERGASNPLVGWLTTSLGRGAIEVAVSPDDGYAFVTEEASDNLVVFDLRRALHSGFEPADAVGAIATQQSPVGMAISADGRHLYATSESAPGSADGTLSVIDLRRAERDPAAAVQATVLAGCDPVRVVAAPDGRAVWVTARASDAVLAFDPAKLATDPAHSLAADVAVGEAPVGMTLAGRGRLLMVGDSNRFHQPGASADVSVISTCAALAGRHALTGKIRSGLFPREFTTEPDGTTVLLTNFDSGQLEAIDTAGLQAGH